MNATSINCSSEVISNCSTNISDSDVCPWRAQYRLRHSALIERWKLCGFFQDDDFLDINCHWLQFEPVPLANHLILVCIFIVILLVGCFCNAVTVYILASSRHLRTPANIVIMNLAISDFFMLVKMPVFLYNSLLQGPALGMKGCEIYGFLSGLTGTTSIMSLAAVAFDRYLVISHPLSINKKPTRARAYATVASIWLYSAIFASLPLFGIGKYVPEGYLTSCSFDYLSDDVSTRIFILTFFVAAWVVPFLIITYCYTAIVWYVRKAKEELGRQQWSQQLNGSVVRNCVGGTPGWGQCAVEVLIAKIVMGLVALWLVSWTPYACVALMGISGNKNRLTADMTMLPALFAKFSACINPVVYTLSHPKIKKEILRRWYCMISSGVTRNGVGDVSGDGGCASAGRQGPVWRPGSADVSKSRSNTGSASPMENYKGRPNIPNRNDQEEPIPTHDQFGNLVDIPLHLCSHSMLDEASTNLLNRRIGEDETCLSNATPLAITDDANIIMVSIYSNCDPQNPSYCPRSELSTGLDANTANSEVRQNEEDRYFNADSTFQTDHL